MTFLFVPVIKLRKFPNNYAQMALKVESDGDIDIHDNNSLDNSADSELLGMVDEGSFGSGSQSHFLDPSEEDHSSSYNFRDLSGSVCTYKIVSMNGDEANSNISSHSPTNMMSNAEYFVITEPMEVYGTTATQKKIVRKNPIQTKAITTKKRDDKRRATHNEVERRRRDKINSWITKLAAMLPNSGLPDPASKGGILHKACDYIADLTEKQKRLEKLEVDNEKLVSEVLRLNQELIELRKESNAMRSQLADNCIVVNQRSKSQKS